MAEQGEQRRLAAILAADMVGYSRLMEADERGTLARQKAQRSELIDPTVARHHGRIVKTTGDGLLVEFASVVDAVECAVAIQRAMAAREAEMPTDRRIQYRIGINIGDIVIDGDDIFGDGVNVAARLESLAESGGICVSGDAYRQVETKLDIPYRDLGERQVKNIAKPLRVYQVLLDGALPETKIAAEKKPPNPRGRTVAAAAFALVIGAAALWYIVLPTMSPPIDAFNGKPSIAVLPFTNMSDDSSQEYFVDGMTEDLITDLAKIESLFVIARNTVFTYKGKSVVVPDIARELSVKYVLEGSVRRVGDRVRINTQLIDGASGAHIWAERYDGSLADIFALQDKVTGEIIAQLQITLTPDEQKRQERKDTDNQLAHDAYLRGWQFYRRYTPEDFVEAIPHFERAVELDPDYGQAWAALASVYWISYRKFFTWTIIVNPDRNNFSSFLVARQKAEKYLVQAMRNPTPLAHQIESQMSWDYRQFDKAISEAERAVALDPNDPEGHLALAWALIFAGRAEEAIASAETGMRLDPYYPAPHLFALGTAHLLMRQYTEAETTLKRASGLNSGNRDILAPLAVAYVHLDRQEEARAALKQFSDSWTLFYAPKIESLMPWWPFKREVDMRLFGGGLVKAGLCCEEQLEAYISSVRQGGTLE
jgi:TolB-like protein/class 3 adenylate cyclase/Flp pilus assembly protein TadD